MSSSFLILGLTSFLDPVLTMLLGLGGGSGKSIKSIKICIWQFAGSRNIFNRKIHALEMKLLEVVGEMGPLHAHSLRLDYLEEV